mgnify:CR=1 FL=1
MVAGPFMQIVDILCHQSDPAVGCLPAGQGPMGSIGLNLGQLGTSHIVEALYPFRVALKGLRCGYLGDRFALPQAILTAKGLQAGLCRDACASQKNNVFCHGFFSIGTYDRFNYFARFVHMN